MLLGFWVFGRPVRGDTFSPPNISPLQQLYIASTKSQGKFYCLCRSVPVPILSLHNNLAFPSAPTPVHATLPTLGQYSMTFGPILEGKQLFTTERAAIPPSPIDLLYHSFNTPFSPLCAKCAPRFFCSKFFSQVYASIQAYTCFYITICLIIGIQLRNGDLMTDRNQMLTHLPVCIDLQGFLMRPLYVHACLRWYARLWCAPNVR
jgi:hypothetical protein